ncbi:hypothetical protein [Actinoplanes subglobosus]|uniref:Uncharacterized protein n=1 Tax=Actinoplanes subglobosus TaxID=1547892 RepID=A0ABV8JBX1_9ACTN
MINPLLWYGHPALNRTSTVPNYRAMPQRLQPSIAAAGQMRRSRVTP